MYEESLININHRSRYSRLQTPAWMIGLRVMNVLRANGFLICDN